MNVVDSSGWLEYFADTTRAKHFAAAIENIKELLVPTISITEVFKRVVEQRGEDAALQSVALMQQGEVIDLTSLIALEAGRLGKAHKLPLADSIMLATARAYRATLWTQDGDFKGLENVQYFEKK